MTDNKEHSPLTETTARNLLQDPFDPFRCPENSPSSRPWARRPKPVLELYASQRFDPVVEQLWNTVLLRTFDGNSGSRPDESHRLLARAPRFPLRTEEDRKEMLKVHVDHGNWTATPFISFTNNPECLEKLAEKRRKILGRAVQRLIVVDPRVRLEAGPPVVHCETEMKNLGVTAPYGLNDWDEHHYLCLWEVTPDEVVGICWWDDLRPCTEWFEDIVMPKVEAFRQERAATSEAEQAVDEDGSDTENESEDDQDGSESDLSDGGAENHTVNELSDLLKPLQL